MILAVDTSNHTIGLCLFDGSQVLAESTWQSDNYHTVELAPAVETMLTRCKVQPRSLELLAVALGPGSFTALRIGLAFIKGMAIAIHRPIVGVPTLDGLAAALPPAELPLIALIQAGRGRLAFDTYQASGAGWASTGNLRTGLVEDLANSIQQPTLVCGELNSLQRLYLAQNCKNARLAAPVHCVRRPALLAQLAWDRWQAGAIDEKAQLTPIYLNLGNPS